MNKNRNDLAVFIIIALVATSIVMQAGGYSLHTLKSPYPFTPKAEGLPHYSIVLDNQGYGYKNLLAVEGCATSSLNGQHEKNLNLTKSTDYEGGEVQINGVASWLCSTSQCSTSQCSTLPWRQWAVQPVR